MAHILVIEDEENSRKFLHENIACYGSVSSTGTFDSNMDAQILRRKYDLIIADYYLNEKNCFQVLSDYRYRLGPVPLILISGKPSVQMLVQAIEEKVYAFIEKPVDISKLKQKIETFYTFNPNYVLSGKTIILFQDDWSVKIEDKLTELTELTETEFKILRYFLDRENQVIDRQELIHYLWGNSKFSRNKLDTHLMNLKNKLPFIKEHLQTIPRVGFKLK